MLKRLIEVVEEIWCWLYSRNLVSFVILFACSCVPFVIGIKNAIYRSIEEEKKLEQAYTIKVIGSKGDIIQSYQYKTIELKDGILYLCPKGTTNCSRDVKAIVINGNYIIEPET